jgi:hypothetical protein
MPSVTSSSRSQHDLSEKREELLRISAERDDLFAGQRSSMVYAGRLEIPRM